MAKQSKAKDEAIHSTTPVESELEWPTVAEAAQMLGKSTRTVMRYLEIGRLTKYQAADGSLRFDPTEIAELDGGRHQVEDKADMLELMVRQNQQYQAHVEKLITLITEPVAKTFKVVEASLERTERRIKELEGQQDELIQTREQMLSQEHERLMMTAQFEASEDRKRAAMQMLERYAPAVLQSVVNRATGPAPGSKSEAAQKLVASLDPGLIGMLKGSGFLTAEQQSLLEIITAPEAPEGQGEVYNVDTETERSDGDHDTQDA